jgi:uncharacterized protein (TIRG00374 family)
MSATFPDNNSQKNRHRFNHPPVRVLGRYLIPLVVIGLAVHLLLPQIASLEKSWSVIQQMAFWAVGLAVLAQIASYLGSGFLLQKVIAVSKQEIPLLRSTLIVLGSASISLVAGGMVGGSAAMFRWVNQKKGNPTGALLATLFPSLFNDLTLVFVSIAGLVYLIILHDLSKAQLVSFLVVLLFLIAIIGVVLIAVRFRARATSFAIWMAKRLARLRRKKYDPEPTILSMNNLFASWDDLRSGGWLTPAFGALLNVGFDMLTLYFLFIAAGHEVSPGILLAGYGLPLFLGKMAFILPGGVGVVEGTMAALYASLSVPNPITVVVILGYRLLSFWIPTLIGFPIAAYLSRSGNKVYQQ